MTSTDVGVISESQVYFLVAKFLSSQPKGSTVLPHLEQALRSRQLLQDRNEDGAFYEQLAGSLKDVPANYLLKLVRAGHTALAAQRAAANLPPRPSGALPSGNMQLGGALLSSMLRREIGKPGGQPEPRVSKELMCSKLRHHRTFRGHSSAVYVLAIDHDSRYVLSGSDDAVMKIWSLSTGVLLNSCRGHEGEITDVKISCDSKMAASSSTDTVIRVWSLEAETLGHPVAVLMGCTAMINYLDWHPILPNALASVSADGSCRIWDATTGTDPIVLRPRDEVVLSPAPSTSTATAALQAGRTAAHASTGTEAPAPEADAFSLTCCAWSRCGTFLAAGGNHCAAYMWMWPVRTIRTAPGSISVRRLQALPQKVRRKLDAHAPVPRSEWPMVQLLSSLDGHKGDIRSVRFNHSGTAVATACADGAVRLFSPAPDAPRGPAAASALRPDVVDLDAGPCEWVGTLTMVCEIQAGMSRPTQRRGRAPKSPEVQQVLWSLDDKRVMAACLSDMSVRVFDAHDGGQLHVLGGHTKALYELAAHPWAPDVVATWSYDGTICVHDVATGKKLTSFDMRHTYPGKGLWTNSEPLCLLDGCWTPSGDALLTTDVAGQFHIFSFGPTDLRSRAAYDQFMRCDYDALQRDTTGAVFDIASGKPAHTSGDRRTCTAFMVPYEDPYQSLAGRNCLSDSVPTRDWQAGECPQSVLANPPLASAVEWNVRNREERSGDVAVQNAIERSTAAQDLLMDQVRAGIVPVASDDEPVLRFATEAEEPSLPTPPATTAAARAPRPPRPQQHAAQQQQQPHQPRRRTSVHRIPSTVDPRDMVPFEGTDDELQISSSDDGNDQEYVQSDGEDDLLQVGRSQPVGGRSTRGRQGSVAGARAGGADRPPNRRRRAASRLAAQRNEIDMREDHDEDEYESEDHGGAAAALHSEDSESEPELSDSEAEGERRSNARQNARPPQRSRRTASRHNSRSQTGQPARRSNRARNPNPALLDDSDDQMFMDLSEDEDRGRRRGRRHGASPNEAADGNAVEHSGGVNSTPATAARPEPFYSWLQDCWPSLAFFVPQAGDKVAYITSLHEDFIARNLLESPNISGPAQLPNVTFRACEPCEIEELDYYIEETSQLTVLRAKLRLLEGTGARHTSNSKNKFEIEIPPPLVGEFSEFLVELERFREQGMAVLEQGSRVKSYMIGAEGRSEWYYGNIEADKLGGTPLDSTELFTAEVVERYQVSWEGDGTVDDLSPWEVYSADVDEDSLKDKLLGSSPAVTVACRRLEHKCHAITVKLQRNPSPLAQLPRTNFQPFTSSNNRGDKKIYNLLVPLPLAVGTMMTRAENRWYRTLPQMRTDIALISSNAERVYQEGHLMREKAADISRTLHSVLDSRESEDEDQDETARQQAQLADQLAGTSQAGTSRAVLEDSPEGPGTRCTRQTRTPPPEQEAPRRETRRRAVPARHASPEPESPEDEARRSRGTRKRRLCASGGWGSAMLSEERSLEPMDRPRRTRQRVTYA